MTTSAAAGAAMVTARCMASSALRHTLRAARCMRPLIPAIVVAHCPVVTHLRLATIRFTADYPTPQNDRRQHRAGRLEDLQARDTEVRTKWKARKVAREQDRARAAAEAAELAEGARRARITAAYDTRGTISGDGHSWDGQVLVLGGKRAYQVRQGYAMRGRSVGAFVGDGTAGIQRGWQQSVAVPKDVQQSLKKSRVAIPLGQIAGVAVYRKRSVQVWTSDSRWYLVEAPPVLADALELAQRELVAA